MGRRSVESIRGIHAINYRAHIHKYLIPFFKDYSMKDITGEAVQEFVSSSTVSPKTTRNIFVTPQSMWSSARAWGCVVASVTLDGSGGFHMVEKENIHMTGSGSLGNSYEGKQEENFQRNGRVGLEQTNPLTVSAIGTGPAPNFEVHVLLHFTVSTNGTVTALNTSRLVAEVSINREQKLLHPNDVTPHSARILNRPVHLAGLIRYCPTTSE